MNLIMDRFSRKLVLLLLLVIWQSSLGTNAALKDFSNVSTKSLSQNGYYKLPDGLMIQWGYVTGAATIKTIYLNSSFLNSDYIISGIGVYYNTSESVVIAPILVSKTTSSIRMCIRYSADSGGGGYSPWPYYWFAVGRWK